MYRGTHAGGFQNVNLRAVYDEQIRRSDDAWNCVLQCKTSSYRINLNATAKSEVDHSGMQTWSSKIVLSNPRINGLFRFRLQTTVGPMM